MTIPRSYITSKKYIYEKIYNSHGETLYIGSSWKDKKLIYVDDNLLNSIPVRYRHRINRTEIEHIIPSSWLLRGTDRDGRYKMEASRIKESYKRYSYKHNIVYRTAFNDLVNLYPSLGAINAMRGDKLYSSIPHGTTMVLVEDKERCLITNRVFVPAKRYRGLIARVGLYMHRTYNITYGERTMKLFNGWDREYPPSMEEMDRDKQIYSIQNSSIFDVAT